MDEYQVGKDIAALEARIKALEARLGSGNCGCKDGPTRSGITMLGMAKETDKPGDPSITTRPDNGPDGISAAGCSDGHLRRVTVNGVCYCQMCCGGQWLYFCYSNGQCIQCPGGVTVNCNGRNWILSC